MSAWVRPSIAAMEGYVPGEQPRGGKFIKLNTNENPYPCSPRVLQAIAAACESGLARYPDPLATSFRQRAADLFGVSPDWILCGNGSDDILTVVTRAMVGEGQRLRSPYPSYILYRTLAEIQQATYEQVDFQTDWSLGEDFAARTADLRLAILANPNSPSGTVVPPETVERLAERLECPLLVDEAYVDFAETTCLDLVRRNEKVMVSRSLSKSYALAGLRFGFLIAQPQIIRELTKVKDSYNCDSLSIAGATAAIDDQDWLATTRQKILATRQRMTEDLAGLGFSVQPSQANFVWCTSRQHSARTLYERLKASGVLVRYMNYAGWPDGLRISVGTDDQVDVLLQLVRSMV